MATAPRRALIVIDVQNEYFTGNLPIEYPPRDESIRKIARAMDAARAASIPVAVVQHTLPSGAPVFSKETPAWQLHPEVAKRPHDHQFEKSVASAFVGTGFADWLAKREINTLVVTGYMTHNCVVSTVFDAVQAGLQVEVLSDATGSLPYANRAGTASAEEIHRAFQVVLHSNFAAVTETDAWINCVAEGRLPERGNIVASNALARSSR